MNWLDRYKGAKARSYDSERAHSLRWANEQRAVADMLFSGPVLDCPLGTGRYASIYQDKGIEAVGIDISPDMLAVAKSRYPDLDARLGSVFDLPFKDKSFEVAVCTRLLDWLDPQEMVAAVRELRRVARTMIVSIRYGSEEKKINYTHDLAKFFAECQGLTICARRVTEITSQGVEEIFRLRPPEWSDLVRQFYWHGYTPLFEVYRLVAEWAEPFGFKPPIIAENTCRLMAEFWSGEDLGIVLDKMTEHHPAYATQQKPRHNEDWPATLFRYRGHNVILDGRRRANRWRKEPGLYPVLVIEPL